MIIRFKEEGPLAGECSKMVARHAGRFKMLSASSTRPGGSPAPPLPTLSELYYTMERELHSLRYGRSQDNCPEITSIKEVRSTDRDIVISLGLDSPIRGRLPLRRALPEYLQETG